MLELNKQNKIWECIQSNIWNDYHSKLSYKLIKSVINFINVHIFSISLRLIENLIFLLTLNAHCATTYTNGLFQNLSQIHSKYLRITVTDFRVPRRNSCNAQKSSYRGDKLWDQLNSDQKRAPSIKALKSTLGPC